MIGKRTAFITLGCAIGVLTFLWFAFLPAGIIMGDDLRLVYAAQHGGYASTPIDGFLHAELGTYRPLLALIFALIVPLFGLNFALYQALNTLVEVGCALVLGAIAYRVSRGNVVVALSGAVAFIFSRFAYYSIGQVFGLMEGLGLLLTLLLVADVVSAYRKEEFSFLVRAALWFCLVVFIDERFVVSLPFLLLAVLLFPQRREIRSFRIVGLCAVPVVIVAINVALKTFVFRSHFLQANGFAIAFNPDSILQFAFAGLLNVIGFNVGPAYLSAQDVSNAGYMGYLLGLLVAIPFGLAAFALMQSFRRPGKRRERMRYTLLWLTLFVPLLISASVGSRQEFRWLYAAYAVALLGLAAIAGNFPERRRAISICAGCLVVGTIASAIFYRTYIGNIYFVNTERAAEQVVDIVGKRNDDPVVVVTNDDPTIEQWVFMEREFFDEFRLAGGRVFYLNAVADLPKLGLPSTPVPTVVDIHGAEVEEIPASALESIAVRGKRSEVLSFTKAYSHGFINSLVPAATPTGRGAFIMGWPSQAGTVQSLTVLATYRFSYPNIRVEPHERLMFETADPYALGIGARAFIDVKSGSKQVRVYDDRLGIASASGPRWEEHDFALEAFAKKTVSITFGADVRDNDPTAAWVAFGDPVIVRLTGVAK